MKTSELSLLIVFAGLYAFAVIGLAPVSFGPVQLRLADALIPLSALLGWPVILGVSIGCLVSNAYFWLSPLDVILGPVANFLAASVIFVLRRRPLWGSVIGSTIIGGIVGGYLWLFFPPPEIFGLSLPTWLAMVISVTLSTLIVISVIGYTIMKALSRPNIINSLVSRGLKVYTKQ